MSAQLPDPIIIVQREGDVRIHTFTSSFTGDNIANSTHIIESRKKLVLIDGQFLAPYAAQFKHYAIDLGKPIERLYLSHRHPDHWFGLETFGTLDKNIDIYALPSTISFIEEHGEESRQDHLKKLAADLVPKRVVVPQNKIVIPQEADSLEETIDGVKYVFGQVRNTECDFHLTMGLPEIGVYIAQDLIYSGTHLYLAHTAKKDIPGVQSQKLTTDIENWIRVLQGMSKSDYKLFLPGHGLPADKIEVAKNIEYLSEARQVISNGLSKYDFKQHMLLRYPGRLCPKIFDIYLPRLFDGARYY